VSDPTNPRHSALQRKRAGVKAQLPHPDRLYQSVETEPPALAGLPLPVRLLICFAMFCATVAIVLAVLR
jgi:hypothetical protein